MSSKVLVLCPSLMDSAQYFLSHLDRVLSDTYEPTLDDRARVACRTSGANIIAFERVGPVSNRERYSIVDTGGQRNERLKWVCWAENVTAIIFVCALSGFDETLFEDRRQNKLVESFDLFADMLQVPFFAWKNVVVLLNKYVCREQTVLLFGYRNNAKNAIN